MHSDESSPFFLMLLSPELALCKLNKEGSVIFIYLRLQRTLILIELNFQTWTTVECVEELKRGKVGLQQADAAGFPKKVKINIRRYETQPKAAGPKQKQQDNLPHKPVSKIFRNSLHNCSCDLLLWLCAVVLVHDTPDPNQSFATFGLSTFCLLYVIGCCCCLVVVVVDLSIWSSGANNFFFLFMWFSTYSMSSLNFNYFYTFLCNILI